MPISPLLLNMSPKDPTSTTSTKPDPNAIPKQRGRKSKKGPTGPKPRLRGLGVAELERRRITQEYSISPSAVPPQCHQQQHHLPILSPTYTHHHNNDPLLAGVPVRLQPGLAQYFGLMLHPAGAVVGPTAELPSIPNNNMVEGYLDNSYKKKRVIGDEVGFIRETSENSADQMKCNLGGLDLNRNGENHYRHHSHHFLTVNGGFPFGYASGSEVLAIHKKPISGSTNVMMEYGFFPGRPDEPNNEEQTLDRRPDNNNTNDDDKHYCNGMADLSLKMGISYYSSPSQSPSSSLSSLTTATTCSTVGGPSKTSLDLSLKL